MKNTKPRLSPRVDSFEPNSSRASLANRVEVVEAVQKDYEKSPVAQGRLTEKEQAELDHCENVLRKGFETFFDVGCALLTIRDSRLYRADFPNFDAYCHERWGIGRSYAWRVIGAAERLRLLPNDQTITRPSNEFQVRPFLKLEPQVFPKAWEQVLKRAGDGKITSNLLRKLIIELSPKTPGGCGTSLPPTHARARNRVRIGEVLVWLHEAKRRVEKGEKDQALVALERIESVLCG